VRRAFTLVEVMVALVVTSLVASVAWTAVQAGLDTGDRLRGVREDVEAEATARALVTAALRHALPGGRGGEAVFDLDPGARPDRARLQFLTRGIEEPLGASAIWRLTIEAAEAGLLLEAVSMEEAAPAIRIRLDGIEGLSVAVMGAGATAWSDSWPTPDLAPARVALRLVARGSRDTPPPISARVGMEAGR